MKAPVHVSTQKIVRVKAELQKEAVYSSATRAGSPTWLGLGLRLGLGLGLGQGQGLDEG